MSEEIIDTPEPAPKPRGHRRVRLDAGATVDSIEAVDTMAKPALEDPEERFVTSAELEEVTSTELVLAPRKTAELAPIDIEKERKKEHWLVRTGRAAILNFRVIDEVGLKKYAIDTFESHKAALSKAAYDKAEELALTVANAFEVEAKKIAGTATEQYKLAMGVIEPTIQHYRDVWNYRRALAKYEKKKRAKMVQDRARSIKQRSEDRFFQRAADKARARYT